MLGELIELDGSREREKERGRRVYRDENRMRCREYEGKT